MKSALLFCTLVLSTTLLPAATITIGPSKDATIFQNNVNNSSGAGSGLFAGTNGTGSPRRGLLEFDIAGNIPAGATIQSVQLTLYLGQVAGSGGGGGGGTSTIDLHRLTADWGEGVTQKVTPPADGLGGQNQGAAANTGDATWNARFFSATTPTLWSTPGGDFLPTVSASATVGTTLANVGPPLVGGTTWGSTANLVSDVQTWLNAPASNFGWAIVNADEVTATDFRAFYTHDAATAAFFPQLSVTFAVPEPTTLWLGCMGIPICYLALRRLGA